MFFPIVFFVVGAALAIYGVDLVREARAAAAWPTAPGRITAATTERLERNKTADLSSHAAVVHYEFTVAGRTYEGSRLRFTPVNFSTLPQAESFLSAYPVGASVPVHYDPADPRRSVLDAQPTGREWLYVLGGVVFCGVGLVSFFRGRASDAAGSFAAGG